MKNKTNIIHRIHRIIGQLNGVEKMIMDDRSYEELLMQLSAADKSIVSIMNLLLDDYMKTELVENIKNDNGNAIEEVMTLIKRVK